MRPRQAEVLTKVATTADRGPGRGRVHGAEVVTKAVAEVALNAGQDRILHPTLYLPYTL